MENDNASRQVISMTETKAQAYARFYFRPLTPTQYYNEGYKHAQLRYENDINANVPVPVFLVFDLEQLLSTEGVVFSQFSQAGHGSRTYAGVECFSQLPFDKIYDNKMCSKEALQYRHAEILCPNAYPIESSLRMILCRNEFEKATLLTLLKEENQSVYYRYKDYVRIAKDDTFERNGLFIESVVWGEKNVSFTFADTPQKRRYDNKATSRLDDLNAAFSFVWIGKGGIVLYSVTREVLINYLSPRSVVFTKMPDISGAVMIKITLKIEDKIICVTNRNISVFEIL